MPKYLLLFEKAESVRWLGHLDVLRAFERAIRRSALPIAFSNGFNPRERLAFASALSTGITSQAEPALLELVDAVDPDSVKTRLNSALPPGIQVRGCTAISDADSKDLLHGYDRAEYEIVCACSADLTSDQINDALSALLSRSEVLVSRERQGRTHTADIRPQIYGLRLVRHTCGDTTLVLRMTVAIGEGGVARPAEVIGSIADLVPGLRLRRAERVRVFNRHDQ